MLESRAGVTFLVSPAAAALQGLGGAHKMSGEGLLMFGLELPEGALDGSPVSKLHCRVKRYMGQEASGEPSDPPPASQGCRDCGDNSGKDGHKGSDGVEKVGELVRRASLKEKEEKPTDRIPSAIVVDLGNACWTHR